MNSLGATPRVKYIYEDLKDGLAIIQVYFFYPSILNVHQM